jgi:NAD(P)H dehydrogenase (quinone)
MTKKILLIVAHPKPESLSFAIAKKYSELSTQQGHHVTLLDLYRSEPLQPFFTFDDASTRETTEAMRYYQAQIQAADELVFIFPYWWGSTPAILKNYLDWNLSRGFAFAYENGRPKGLLTGKTVKLYTTTGAP